MFRIFKAQTLSGSVENSNGAVAEMV